ncbi:hypothetical protein PAPYR_9724 [Paratrimastix pyriformis]|uniref:Uncharacterized protein n=1 Tax=Paratrimastix pyriformis TaxID=342808 RepID=A0ABQ8U7M2_9EUKA|nr:hypothetical protein PAPYR_9724 [Paratrimastix pyriformis]
MDLFIPFFTADALSSSTDRFRSSQSPVVDDSMSLFGPQYTVSAMQSTLTARPSRGKGRGVLRFRPLAPVPAAAQHSGVSGRLGAFPRVALTRNGPLRLPPTMQLGAWTALTHPGPAQGRPRQNLHGTACEVYICPHLFSRLSSEFGHSLAEIFSVSRNFCEAAPIIFGCGRPPLKAGRGSLQAPFEATAFSPL